MNESDALDQEFADRIALRASHRELLNALKSVAGNYAQLLEDGILANARLAMKHAEELNKRNAL